MNRRIGKFSLILLAVAPCAAFAGVYKWIDDNGVTHYSQTPPAGRSSRQIEVPAVAPASAPARTFQEQERELRQQRLQREQSEEAQRNREVGDAATRRQKCLSAQSTLHILEMQRPIYSVNEKGERVFIEDSDRPAAIEAARENVRTYCSD